MSGPYGDYDQSGGYPQYENIPPPVNPSAYPPVNPAMNPPGYPPMDPAGNPAPGYGQHPNAGVDPYGNPYAPQQVNPANYPAPHVGAPGYQPAYYAPRSTNGMAVASMVLGIVWVYWIGSALALIFGYVARQQIKQRGQAGDGMAIAGIVLGWIGIGIFIIMMLSVASFFRY